MLVVVILSIIFQVLYKLAMSLLQKCIWTLIEHSVNKVTDDACFILSGQID